MRSAVSIFPFLRVLLILVSLKRKRQRRNSPAARFSPPPFVFHRKRFSCTFMSGSPYFTGADRSGLPLSHRYSHRSPFRQEMIHKMIKSLIMAGFQQMSQFVDDDIFQTFRRHLNQPEIQPNAGLNGIACSPSRPHIPDAPFFCPDAYECLAFCENRRNRFSHLAATPFFQDFFPLRLRAVFVGVQHDSALLKFSRPAVFSRPVLLFRSAALCPPVLKLQPAGRSPKATSPSPSHTAPATRSDDRLPVFSAPQSR